MQLHQTPRDLLYHLEATTSSDAKRKWKESIKEHWNYECAYCGSKQNLTLDHIIPKSKGGSDKITNIVCACKDCNHDKGHQFWSEWYLNQHFYTTDKLSAIIKWQNQNTENTFSYGR
jgi:predicted restriction endonuclease